MDTKKVIKIAGMAFAIVCVVLGVMAVQRQMAAPAETRPQGGSARQARELTNKVAPSAAHLNSPAKEPARPKVIEAQRPPTEEATVAQQVRPALAGPDVAPKQIAAAQQTGPQKPPAQDPLAREALSLVGADFAATEYWTTAINDPNLPDDERKDLIEDLNEDGLSDADHPGPEDLPLILNRIELIEELAPYAMDQVNADAFAEAYKDLLNMLDGRPVQ